MADEIEVKITGLDELQSALEQLADKAGTKTLRAAGRAGGEVLREEMVLLAPKSSGLLSEHHDIRTKKQRGEPLAITVTIGPNNKTVIHKQDKGKTAGLPRTARAIAAMLEWGTSKMAKRPYLTQAYEVAKAKAVDRVIEVLKDKLGLN